MKHLIVERLAKVQVLMIFHHQLLNAVIKTFNPIKHVFSLSLKQGIFPENLKIARVSPIFKKDEKFLFTNYRPISVLPCFSKLLEKIMCIDFISTSQKTTIYMKSSLASSCTFYRACSDSANKSNITGF